MATSNTKTLIYDDWTGGEFGVQAPDKAPDGTWTGTNVVVYQDHTIGPRPGLKEVDLTGMPSGRIRGFGFIPTATDTEPSHWVIIGRKVYCFRPKAAGFTVRGTDNDLAAPGVTTGFVNWKESTRNLGGEAYITIPDDKTYRLNFNTHPTANTLTPITDSPGGNDIETYKERLVVAGSAPSVRARFSEAADFTDWSDAANYFDIGASWPIDVMMEYRDGLVIFTAWGIWLVTGSLGSSATLRRISEALPALAKSVVRTNEDLFYIPSTRSAPVLYNGTFADEKELEHLENWKADSDDSCGVMIYGNRDLLFTSESNELLWRKNDVWSKHEFSVDAGPAITRLFDNVAILTDEARGGGTAKFYYLNMAIERPTFTSDSSASVGDDSSTPVSASFRIPDYFSPTGEEIRVRRVIVDFTKYRTGAAATNNITCTVDALARYNRAQTATSAGTGDSTATFSWTEANATAPSGTSGTRDRATFQFGQQGWHGGFRLTLSALRGVKIHRILVDIETLTERPRS